MSSIRRVGNIVRFVENKGKLITFVNLRRIRGLEYDLSKERVTIIDSGYRFERVSREDFERIGEGYALIGDKFRDGIFTSHWEDTRGEKREPEKKEEKKEEKVVESKKKVKNQSDLDNPFATVFVKDNK